MARKKIIGLLVGRENTFPGPFLDIVNQKGRADGISAELAVLGGTTELAEQYHAVLVDRISHEVPYYRAHLKSAVLLGTTVINDPFWWEADEKFFECTLARKLGVAVPKTVVLPNKQYIPDIDHKSSLRNLQFPLDWEHIVSYTGLPAVLKPNTGGGWKDVFIARSIQEDNFRWVLEKMSDLVLSYARGEASPPWRNEHRWWNYVAKTPAPAPDPVQA